MSTNLITSGWGYIGKMPAKGDFVKDGLSQDFSERWHDWQQAVIAVSREQLGESWNEH
ncbi:type VI secretion system-associated protein TagF, partial [Vibrio alginolyticus]